MTLTTQTISSIAQSFKGLGEAPRHPGFTGQAGSLTAFRAAVAARAAAESHVFEDGMRRLLSLGDEGRATARFARDMVGRYEQRASGISAYLRLIAGEM